jgi:hypothetical protein
MNTINVSNPSVNNILMLLNMRGNNPDKPKKRPTYDEVFNKISKRTQNLKSTKQPLNNILTNDQLFRFYIQDTQPLLQKSNDTFNEGGNNQLLQALTASKPSQNTTYGVADIGNTNEPNNVPQSRDYVDNPDNTAPTTAPAPIAFDDMTDEQKLQYAYDGSIEVLKFFNSLNMEGNNAVETGTLLNAILMRDAMTDGWRSFGYDLLNDFYNTGQLELVIGELYTIMTRAKAENPNTYEQITDTLYNIMRIDVDGLSKDEVEAEIFRYIQNPPAYYGYRQGTSYQGELAKYKASVSRTPSKIVEDMLTQMRQQIQSKSLQVPDETPTPEVGGVASPPLKDPSTFPPRPQELKNPATFPPRTDEDIFKAQAGQAIRGMMDSLFSDEATANETDTEPFAGFEVADFTPMRVNELLLKVPSFMDYNTLPENIKPFYQKPTEPREQRITNIPYVPPLPLEEQRESLVQPRGRGRPAGSRNRPRTDIITREYEGMTLTTTPPRRRRGEAEMRQVLLDEVRRDIVPPNLDFKYTDTDIEDMINDIFS